MLREARMAGLVKLRRGIGVMEKGPLRAVRDDITAAFERVEVDLFNCRIKTRNALKAVSLGVGEIIYAPQQKLRIQATRVWSK